MEISDSHYADADVGAGEGRQTPDGWIQACAMRGVQLRPPFQQEVLERAMKQREVYHKLAARVA